MRSCSVSFCSDVSDCRGGGGTAIAVAENSLQETEKSNLRHDNGGVRVVLEQIKMPAGRFLLS